MKKRISRCKGRNPNQYSGGRNRKKAIGKVDNNRAKYYEFFTNATWGDRLHYDICLNTSNCNIKEVSVKLADLAGTIAFSASSKQREKVLLG